MDYKQNVRAVSIEMARDEYANKYEVADTQQREAMISEMESKAVIAVCLQAEAFRDGAEWGTEGRGMDSEMIERGLIPAPEVIVPNKVVSSCPYCNSSPYHTERGLCEDCGQGEGYEYL